MLPLEQPGRLLSALSWDALFVQLYRSPSYQVVIGSGALLTLGLLGRYLGELVALHRGERPDFLAPAFRLVLFAVMIGHYQQLCLGLLRFVSELGHGMLGAVSVEALWELRRDAFAAHGAAQLPTEAVQSREALVVTGLAYALHLALCASQGAIVVVRTLQVFLLLVSFLSGPWLLALSFVGGPFAGLGMTWLLGTLQAASWSWGLKMLAFCLDKVLLHVAPHTFSFSHELTVSASMAVCVLCVPWVMGRLLRPQRWAFARTRAAFTWPNFVPAVVATDARERS